MPVPNGLAPDVATLTEPMAVGWHAVRRGEVKKRTVAVVIGCGPVGLAVICLLKSQGVRTVVASDYSPRRRALATACGADAVVDPAEGSPFAAIGGHGHLDTVPAALDLAVGTMEKLRRLPVPWWQIWRAAEAVGAAKPRSPVIFECVGVPGVIDDIISTAPLFSRVVVVGVCMGDDRIRPSMAINKEIDLRFVVGYTPLEFRDTLHMLAEGKVNPAPMVTGVVGLDGVDEAFSALGNPEAHAKILIDPEEQRGATGAALRRTAGAAMTVEVFRARSEREREELFRFRYAVYVEELGRYRRVGRSHRSPARRARGRSQRSLRGPRGPAGGRRRRG